MPDGETSAPRRIEDVTFVLIVIVMIASVAEP